jgi:hypothetical protein
MIIFLSFQITLKYNIKINNVNLNILILHHNNIYHIKKNHKQKIYQKIMESN